MAQHYPTALPDSHGWLGKETINTRYGEFQFRSGYPEADSAHRLRDWQLFNRAVEVYTSHVPAVSTFQFRKGLADWGVSQANEVVIWESIRIAALLSRMPPRATHLP
jgi:hypothetical protein